jgi:isopentenyl-diphosphate delta-isomerase
MDKLGYLSRINIMRSPDQPPAESPGAYSICSRLEGERSPVSERQRRKLDHVRLSVAHKESRATERPSLLAPGWDEVHLVHQSLPERNFDEIDLQTSIAGLSLPVPVLINAMTGGAAGVGAINRDLAVVAADLGLAMAVGSQTAGLREPAVADTYAVVREVNPYGIILANLSAAASVEQAREAIAMVRADLLQIHLNAPQELVMAEGDREFRGQLANIGRLVAAAGVPVIVKECGFGLSREAVRALYGEGVRAVDVSGRGGTNFAWIEAQRTGESLDPGLENWGIPTAVSVVEITTLGLNGLEVIASGGIASGTEVAKALALGARVVGLAGAVLIRQQQGGADAVRDYLSRLLIDLRRTLLLCGTSNLHEVRQRPVVITGATGQWCHLRGVDLTALAQRY